LKQTVEAGKTLLVDGPASIENFSGKAGVFGYLLKENQRTVVRGGKRLPFFVLETAEFNISLGPNASIQEFGGCNIPTSWTESAKAILNIEKKPVIVLVAGEVDSGKSSYTTYLANKLISAKRKVAILDGDLGQSDVGPPGTIAYALTSKSFPELYELKVTNAFFVGVTSPVQALEKCVEGLVILENEILSKPAVDCIIINTDGWVSGEGAVEYKLRLVEELKPDIVVGIQKNKELALLLNSIEKTPVIELETSAAASERSPEKRKILRNLSYTKYMKDAKIRSLLMNYVEIKDKNLIPKEPGKDKGVLVGLKSKKRFLGIGVIHEVNRNKRTLKLLTPVRTKPATVIIGRVNLDKKLNET
jgi:polynucleotide 5'-hydroxyl-kinase GRC3/NOL9